MATVRGTLEKVFSLRRLLSAVTYDIRSMSLVSKDGRIILKEIPNKGTEISLNLDDDVTTSPADEMQQHSANVAQTGFFQAYSYVDEEKNEYGFIIRNADGFNSGTDTDYAGIVLAGTQTVEVLETFILASSPEAVPDGTIVLKLMYNPALEIGKRYTGIIMFIRDTSTTPVTPNTLYLPLATVTNKKVFQIYKGNTINLNGKYLV